jgi:hypothetical protein
MGALVESGVLGEKPIPVPLCLQQILRGSNPDFRGKRPATNALSRGTAFYVLTTDTVYIIKTKRLCCLGEKSPFVVEIIRNPQIHSVGKRQFLILKGVVRTMDGVLKL